MSEAKKDIENNKDSDFDNIEKDKKTTSDVGDSKNTEKKEKKSFFSKIFNKENYEKVKAGVIIAKDKTVEFKNKTIEKNADRLLNSSFVIRKEEDFSSLAEENSKFIVIFGEFDVDYFKKALLKFPLLLTKGWVSSYKLRFFHLEEGKKDTFKKYDLSSLPTMIVFKKDTETKKIEVFKQFSSEEEINKEIKKLSLDIEK